MNHYTAEEEKPGLVNVTYYNRQDTGLSKQQQRRANEIRRTYQGEQLPQVKLYPDAYVMTVTTGGYAKTQRGGGARGKISGFSRGSRRRLMRFIGTLNKKAQPVFATLTYSDAMVPVLKENPRIVKRHLNHFFTLIRREWPGVSGVWRIEVQDRKSGSHIGEMVPHVHILLYGIDGQVGRFREWLSKTWYRVVGSGDEKHRRAGTGIDCYQKISGRKMLFSYLSKYHAKVMAGDGGLDLGRVWGWINKQGLPLTRPVVILLERCEAVQLIRYARRYIRRKRLHGSLTILCDAAFWYVAMDRMLYPE